MKLVDIVSMAPRTSVPSVRLSFLRSTSHAFLASIPRHLSSSYRAPIFRLDSADSPLLFLSLYRTNISPSAASSSDRIEESSETAAISAEIESQNGENDCECFLLLPPHVERVVARGCRSVGEGGTGAEEDGELSRSEKVRHQMEQRAREEDGEKERVSESDREQVEMHSKAS